MSFERLLKTTHHCRFNGFRGAQSADLNGAADVILAVASMVENDPSSIVELDINPLMLLAEGQGVVAADALIKMYRKEGGKDLS